MIEREREINMKVVILYGGFSAQLREQTEIKPKPMVETGRKSILWNAMKKRMPIIVL